MPLRIAHWILRILCSRRKTISSSQALAAARNHLQERQSRASTPIYEEPVSVKERAFWYDVYTSPYVRVLNFRVDIETGEIIGAQNLTPLEARAIAEQQMLNSNEYSEFREEDWNSVITITLEHNRYRVFFGPTHPEIIVEVGIQGDIITSPKPACSR